MPNWKLQLQLLAAELIAMMVLSRRGYHVDIAENTIEAFKRALSMGIGVIETDVCFSADRMPTLFHDRLAPDGRGVAAISQGVLCDLVVHSVPSLDDLAQLIVKSAKHV